jgi:fatty-acyl-CoA synthase
MLASYEAPAFGSANFVPLSPIAFLQRAETVYADKPATSYAGVTRTWAQVARRVRSVAAALSARGIGLGDTVSVLSPNRPELFELHFAVPLVGAVLNTINTRLEADTVAYILAHSDAQLVVADPAIKGLLRDAFAHNGTSLPVIDLARTSDMGFGDTAYDDLTKTEPLPWALPKDEGQALALNYTSGTSGRPKGVIYHHRGAYLMALGTVAGWSLPQNPTYLSVVPMFHCNGWNHPWAMAIVGGHLVFPDDMAPKTLLAAMVAYKVTHLGAAPVILQMMAESADAPQPFAPPIKVMTAGAPPPPSVLEKASELGLEVMQVYGLTETFGHISQCLWQDAWGDLAPSERAEKQAMQGVAFPMVDALRVVNRTTGQNVPCDGETQGEIAIRSNTVMKGYYKDPTATNAAFEGGWFWSGDGAVIHSDGYVQIRDRLKDVIISGGENISSVEVESVLYRHPDVAAAAVVARPHARWGEAPCAFVELRDTAQTNEDDIIAFCRQHLAGFKCPKSVVFQDLPKTATGKIQKFILRQEARALGVQE